MKRIAVLIVNPTVDLTAITGTAEIFEKSNAYLNEEGRPKGFEVKLVGLSKGTMSLANNLQLDIECSIQDIESPSLIVIPPNNDPMTLLNQDATLLNWICQCYLNGSEVASLCTGAFLLATTGLLDKKKCSTHWIMAQVLQSKFPAVTLVPENVITDQEGIYTSGGAYSYLNLLIYLLEKYQGRDLAHWTAKMFGIDVSRTSQLEFMIFKGQKNHNDHKILQAQEYIEENYKEKLTVTDLADLTCLEKRTLIRRFKKATFSTPIDYIQRVKIEAAKRSLESSIESVSEIMFNLSWVDENSFRKIFKKHVGMTPKNYREKYARI